MSAGLRAGSPGIGTRLRERVAGSSFSQRLALLTALSVAVAVVLASGINAATTVLLLEKTRLHDLAARVDDAALRATLSALLITGFISN